MTSFSILDLSTVSEGATVADALENTRRMAIAAEEAGYKRVLACRASRHGRNCERGDFAGDRAPGHATSGFVSVPAASCFQTISPYVIAEQFGTLAALFPAVSTWVSPSAGTDMATARALRRDLQAAAERFPDDILELKAWLGPTLGGPAGDRHAGHGIAGAALYLGSSLYSAHLAAALGLPYAFASHFGARPAFRGDRYLSQPFRAFDQLDQPYVMAGVMGVWRRRTRRRLIIFTSPSSNSSTCAGAAPENIRRGPPIWTNSGRRWSGRW